MANSLLVRNIKCLVGTWPAEKTVARGAEMAALPMLENAFLLVENQRVKSFGPMADCPERADETLDATGRFVLPAFCDSHTHIVYAASREGEFVDRIKGLTYEEISKKGGGILNSARRLQAASEDQLFDSAWQRLNECIGFGTGAIEIKSGYGLTLDSELKMLRVIRRLREKSPIPVRSTFLGAHALPMEFRGNREAYLDIVCHEMLPKIAEEGLADYCDVFCETGFFTAKETDRILKAGLRHGLQPKVHANELDFSGGVQVGVANGAVSVDHLECVGDEEVAALKTGQTMATLLPSTAFFLGINYAPARLLIDAGLPVALASDFNPGTTPSGRMPFVLSLACIQMKMLPEEAVTAATLNGARAMGIEAELGSLAPGKIASFILTKPMPSLAFLPYSFGSDLLEKMVVGGRVL